MMSVPFDPTRVPAGTLQGMARRLSKHPALPDVPLSKCQEILAQTFGHTSFHALKTHQPASRAVEGFRDVTTRIRFYTMLEEPLRARVDLMSSLAWIEELARRGGRWPLGDLAQACRQTLANGLTLAQSLEALGTEAHAPECFIIARFEEQGDLAEGVKEARILAEQEAHMDDMRRLSARSAESASPLPTDRMEIRDGVAEILLVKTRDPRSSRSHRIHVPHQKGEQP